MHSLTRAAIQRVFEPSSSTLPGRGRGIGRSIMVACERAIIEAGYRRVDLVATLAGEQLYASFGYAVVERYDITMAGGLRLPVIGMTRSMGKYSDLSF